MEGLILRARPVIRWVSRLTSSTTTPTSISPNVDRLQQLRNQLNSIPSLNTFLHQSRTRYRLEGAVIATRKEPIPYLDREHLDGQQQCVFVETYEH